MGGMVQSGSAVDVALRHGPWTDQAIYVCGSPTMVDGTPLRWRSPEPP